MKSLLICLLPVAALLVISFISGSGAHQEEKTCGVGNPDGRRTDGKSTNAGRGRSSRRKRATQPDDDSPDVGVSGGRDVRPGEFPWQVRILTLSMEDSRKGSSCGGTILSPNWVVTAAHCVHQCTRSGDQVAAYEDRVLVIVGDYSQRDDNDGNQLIRSEQIIMHPEYDLPCGRPQTDRLNDIALIQTEKPMYIPGYPKFTKDGYGSVNAACMPPSGSRYTGMAIATGWGKTGQNRGESDTLQAVEMEVINTRECRRWNPKINEDQQVCIQDKTSEGKGVGRGDSGGPIVVQMTNVGQSVVLGAASYIMGEQGDGKPDVYASLAHFRLWIEQQTGENFPTLDPN